MKTEALKQALDLHGFDAAFGGARRDEEKSRAKERIFSFRSKAHAWDPRNQRPGTVEPVQHPHPARANPSGCSRCRTGPNSTSGTTSCCEDMPSCRFISPRSGRWCERDGTWIMVDDERMPLSPAKRRRCGTVRFRTLGCYPLTRRHRVRRGTLAEIVREMHARARLGAAGPPDRQRRSRFDGKEEAGRVFLMDTRARSSRRRSAA